MDGRIVAVEALRLPVIPSDYDSDPDRWRSCDRNDPELTDGYPPTPFDAEEAPAIVAAVFGDVHVERWDEPMTHLPDRDHGSPLLPVPFAAPGCSRPLPSAVWLTDHGCVVYAYRQ